jgi:protocatechuate 3,4-dioxygenase beta subunit
MIDIQIRVSNIDNSTGAFRIDLLDDQQIPVKLDIFNDLLRFGSNLILREATYSHGVFMRTFSSYLPPKSTTDQSNLVDVETNVELATQSNAYTWIIDNRFRNGELATNDVATLDLKVEFIINTNAPPGKVSDINSVLYELKVNYTDPLGPSSGTESLLVPIDYVDYINPTGLRTYTTVIAPSGLQAGEPFLVEIGLINYDSFGAATYDLRLNQGMTSFSSNSFYMNYFANGVPLNFQGGPLSFSSLSYKKDVLHYSFNVDKAALNSDITNGSNSKFRLAYLPNQNEYSITSSNCTNSSYSDICGISPIGIFPGSVNRLFIQGVATLEMAGSNFTLLGDISFEESNNQCADAEQAVCKSVSGTQGAPNSSVFSIEELIPIASYTFTKVVSDPCFEKGESGFFKIELSGADFRKVSSVWFVSDLVPEVLTPNNIMQNFNFSGYNIGYEFGAIAEEPGGGFLYSFNNTYFPFYYPSIPTKSTNSVQTINGFDYDWYEQIWFKLPFIVEDNAIFGTYNNTASFDFMTYPFVNTIINKVVPDQVMIQFSGYFPIDKETIGQYINFIDTEYDSNNMEASADFNVGCTVVSGRKFEDLNGNGLFDTGEPGLEGWEITLQGSAGTDTTTTNAQGLYSFDAVTIGNYQVREVQQDGWLQSFPAGEGFYNVSIPRKGSTAVADFGNYRPARVFGFKYEDKDGSGSFDEAEPAMVDVLMQLKDLSGNVVAQVLTDNNGYYEFDGIDPGHYAVTEVIPNGMYQSQPGPGEGGFYYLVLTSGSVEGAKNFGNYYLTSLAGDLYYTDSSDPKLAVTFKLADRTPAPGIIVTGVRTGPAPLKPASGEPVVLPGLANFQVETDDDGHFHVVGLLPGLYTVAVLEPAYTTSVTANPLTEVLASGADVEVEFGLFYDEYAAPEVTNSSITGSIFADANGDGRWQYPAETGVAGRTVTISGTTKRGSALTRTTATNELGTYTFTELPEGRYVVSVLSAAEVSVSAPISASHVVVLGANEDIGTSASGAPGGSGWLQSALAGSDATFGSLVLVLDTNADGIADTRYDLSGLARFELGGITGQMQRPFTLRSLAMYGDGASAQPLVAATPGLIQGSGELSGSGSMVGGGLQTGIVISVGEQYLLTSEAIPFVGSADRWPVRNTSAVFNTAAAGAPVVLRDPFGKEMARIMYAEHTPTFGVDFAAERVDFGDAPASYGTLRATSADPFVLTPAGIVYPLDGARHLMPWTGTPSLTLGSSATADLNGQPDADANGDFDNGVILPLSVAPNAAFNATVNVTGTGLLSVWVDQNRNGLFESAEKLVNDRSVETGEYVLALQSGAMATSGVTYMRVRLSTQSGVGAIGLALDGEVEDYKVVVDAAKAGGGGGLPTSDDGDETVPTSFALHQNYPNPFNPSTVIPYDLASTGRVRITVYDVTGRPVATLLDAQQNGGRHQLAFNAVGLPSGVYMVRLEAGGQVMVRKLTLLK